MTRYAQNQQFREITRDTPSAIAGRLMDGRILIQLIVFNLSIVGNRAQSTQIDKRIK